MVLEEVNDNISISVCMMHQIYPAGKEHQAKAANSEPAIAGKSGLLYYKHGAFCLETQKYPDSVNHVSFGDHSVIVDNRYLNNVCFQFNRQTFQRQSSIRAKPIVIPSCTSSCAMW